MQLFFADSDFIYPEVPLFKELEPQETIKKSTSTLRWVSNLVPFVRVYKKGWGNASRCGSTILTFFYFSFLLQMWFVVIVCSSLYSFNLHNCLARGEKSTWPQICHQALGQGGDLNFDLFSPLFSMLATMLILLSWLKRAGQICQPFLLLPRCYKIYLCCGLLPLHFGISKHAFFCSGLFCDTFASHLML